MNAWEAFTKHVWIVANWQQDTGRHPPVVRNDRSQFWSPAAEATLKRMYLANHTHAEIAEVIGRTPLGVKGKIQVLGLAKLRDRKHKGWTEQATAEMLTMIEAGKTTDQIMAATGRTRASIASKITALRMEGVPIQRVALK